VYFGWVSDFWEPFAWYLRVEKNLPATYFVIPFKRRAGERVPGQGASRRATAYDVSDIRDWAARLSAAGCELGVHGIDAWHSVPKGRDELNRVVAETAAAGRGIRMHWLLGDERTAATLEQAGYAYDSTAGYNDAIGYRNGTAQVFRPAGAESLLELPLHIQDGALFYPQKLDLSEPEAEKRCAAFIDRACSFGGVLTLLWHDRSHGPERFWGEFYIRLIERLKAANAWFGTAGQIVEWFRARRGVWFETFASPAGVQVVPRAAQGELDPPLLVRLYRSRGAGSPSAAAAYVDVAWNGGQFESLQPPAYIVPFTAAHARGDSSIAEVRIR
jgi:hypothetical protein